MLAEPRDAVAMHPALAPNDVLRESLKVDLELQRSTRLSSAPAATAARS